MEKEVLFERLFMRLKETHEWIFPEQAVGVGETVFGGRLLDKWQEFCLELAGLSLEEFRQWARETGKT